MIDRRHLLCALAASVAAPAAARAAGSDTTARDTTAFDFVFTDIDGAPLALDQYRGRPMMVVNTASRCGFTYQYDALQALWQRYRDLGFVLIGVPSDDFGGQELASEAAVKDFCAVNFAIDFPMTEIVHVRGRGAHPFYRWAASASREARPQWNFHKILIGPEGRVQAGFASGVDPLASPIVDRIDAMLAQRAATSG